MDYGHKQADLMLKDTEKRLQKIYAQAAKETEQKVKDYYDKYATKYNAKLADLRAGKISKADFTKWNQGQIMIGKRWEEMRDTIATDLTNTNKIAASVINGHLPEVYALNHNYGTFEVEKGSKVNTSYTLYNRQAVERLVRDDPNLLPKPGVNTKKDIRWNKSNFNSGILQGILQGESIDKIAKRVALGTSSKDMSIAIRNARTAFTGAQNRGRYDSYCRAADMGIKIMKQWSAALDTHTRNSHRELDGEEVPYNEEFSNGLMYPGDPDGEPAEVYNCRCAMIADIDENLTNVDPSMINPELADMSFDEWEDWHLNGGADVIDDILPKAVLNIIGKRGKPVSIEDIKRYTNPNFGVDKRCRVNCQRCAASYELQRRGYKVEALPFNGDYHGSESLFDMSGVWKDDNKYLSKWNEKYLINRSPKAVAKSIKAAMDDWGDGARATLSVTWRGTTSSHIVNVEKVDGITTIIDSQCGRSFTDIEAYLSETKCAETELLRMDTLSFKDDINIDNLKTICKKRS